MDRRVLRASPSVWASAVSLLALICVSPLAARERKPDPAGEIVAPPDIPRPAGALQADNRIVVTGILLRTTRTDALAPVDVINTEELTRQGNPSILDLTRRLPVSAGVLGDSSQFDPRSAFNEGAASINLRGLGPQRTLVLLNGRRLAPSGSGNVPLVDVNLLPIAALDRIEILKGGAAATYGSDAIAGVVNVITRTRQDGFLASADYRAIRRSVGDWTGALSWGRTFADARVLLAAGYQHRSKLQVPERDFAYRPYAQNPQGGWSGGGNPGNFDFNGATGGIAFVADEGCQALGGFRTTPGSAADLCYGNFVGFTNLIEPEDRFQLFADFEADIAPQAALRLTALFGRTDTKLFTSPSFLPTIAPSPAAAFGGTGLFTIPAYAPALADYCARYGPDAGGAAGCALDVIGTPQSPALAYPVRFRPLLAGGNPLFDNERGTAALDRYAENVQLTAELTADLGSGTRLVAGTSFAQNYRFFEVGDVFVDLFQNALAGFGGPACPYAAPSARTGLMQEQLAAIAGTAGCSWFNPFSTGVARNRITGEANPNYAGGGSPLELDTNPGAGLVNDPANVGDFYNIWGRTARTRQFSADVVLSTNSGVRLPGGEIELALGAQYRRDGYARTYQGGNNLDAFPCPGSVLDRAASCNPQTGALGFIGAGRNVDVTASVSALFAEALVPLTPSVTAQLSARYENYGGTIGSTFDPQVRVVAELTDWLNVRAGIGTTFRGPSPQSTAADLVALTFIGGAFRAIDVFANPNLAPESATTYNVGFGIARSGFSASVDYWRYKLSGPIETEPVSGIVAALFGASGTANCADPAYTNLRARFTFSGGICSAANVQRLATFAFNSADITTSGTDLRAGYAFEPGGGVALEAGVSASFVFEYKVADTQVEGIIVQPAFDAAGLLNYQTTAYPLPQVKGQAWLEASIRAYAVRLQVNHVGSYHDTRTALFAPDNTALAGATVEQGQRIGAFTTLDATWRWMPAKRTSIALALTNLLDAHPPFARLDHSFDPFTADALGLTAKLGVNQAF